MRQSTGFLGIVLGCALIFASPLGEAGSPATRTVLVAPPNTPGGDLGPCRPVLVFEITATGSVIALPSIPAEVVCDPSFAAFNAQGELFVSNRNFNRGTPSSIFRFRFDPDTGGFVSNGTIVGNGLTNVHQVAFSPDGELFAANYNGWWCKSPCDTTVTVSRFLFDAAGNAIPNGTFNAGYATSGLAVNSNGELFVSRMDYSRMIERFRFDPITKAPIYAGSFSVPGMIAPLGLTFTAQGELFAADIYAGYVWRFLFDSSGNPISNGAIFVSGDRSIMPISTAFSPSGEAFVGKHWTGGINRYLFGPTGEAIWNGEIPTPYMGGLAIYTYGSQAPAPVASAGPDQTVDEDTPVTLDGSASTGQNPSYNWTQLAGESVQLSGATSPSPTFVSPQLPGGFGSQVLTFQLTVTSGGQSSSDTVDVIVRNVNHAPVPEPGPSQTVQEGSGVTLDGTASWDPDRDPIACQWAQTDGTPVQLTSGGNSSVFAVNGHGVADLAFDSAGRLYATNWDSRTITRYDSMGNGTVFAFDLPSNPIGLAFDKNGVLYVASDWSGIITAIDPSGTKSVFASGLACAKGLAFDSSGNLYVGNCHGGTVDVFDPSGHRTTFASGLNFPHSIAVRPSDTPGDPAGTIYVSATFSGTIMRYDSSGNGTVFASGFPHPIGLAFDSGGALYVADGAGTIVRFDPSGTRSVFASGMNGPSGLAFDAGGNLYVAVSQAGTILKFDRCRASFTAPPHPGGQGGPLALGFTLTVTDGGLTASAPVSVFVEQENHAPVAVAEPPQTVRPEQVVVLSGSGSSDPDGDPIAFAWAQVGGPPVGLQNPTTVTPSFTAPPVSGTVALTFRLVVSDGKLSSAPADVVIIVKNGPPLCELGRAEPSLLWPPNHGMVPVQIVGVTDPDDAALSLQIVQVTQDEPVNGLGDGDTSPDAILQADKVLLRAERAGTGNGRVYQVHFRAEDGLGGLCMGIAPVVVPHSKKPGVSITDDGQLYDSRLP